MNKVAAIALAAALAPAGLHAQGGVGVAPHIGTMGLGVDVAVSLHRMFGVRAGANVFPMEIDATASDIDYTIELPSPQFTAVLDFYPGGSIFRLSGGIMHSANDIDATGEFTGTVEIGGQTYDGDDVGTLTGAIINKDLAPYLGLGLGNPAGSRFGFFLDLGLAFHGAPEVTLSADGPIAAQAQFQDDLEDERAQFEEDIEAFKVYPVVSVGFSIGFPRSVGMSIRQ